MVKARRNAASIETQERGSVLIELAIVLPVLLLLALSAIELSNWLSVAQRVSFLSREAANSAFRRCTERPLSFPGSVDAATCLTQITEDIYQQASQRDPDLAIRVHLFREGGIEVSGAAFGTIAASNIETISDTPRFSQILNVKGRLVIAEVELAYRPLCEGLLPRYWSDLIRETTLM